jgi:hypothetical protein
MIHPHTELRRVSDHIGFGVFATERIPKGTIVWVLDALDQRIDEPRYRALWPDYGTVLDRFTYLNGKGERILCWDLARYMNHSCEATCLSPGLDFEIAVRDIAAGEEITDDYASLNLDGRFECGCGSRTCRRTIRPEDFEVLAPAWDGAIREAFPKIPQVPQPLWPFVGQRDEISAGVADPGHIPSILRHHFAPHVAVGAGHAGNGRPSGKRPARVRRKS